MKRSELVLRLRVPRATALDIARGLDAAMEVFARHGLTPHECARADGMRETWSLYGYPSDETEPSDAQHVAADAWLEALQAAIDACCSGWAERPRLGYGDGLSLQIPSDEI